MYHINSDNSISSTNKISKSSNEIIQVKDRDNVNKKNRKPIKKEESRKTLKNKEKQEPGTPQTEDMSEEEMEKIKKKVGKVCRIHKNQRAQRYLLIKPPKTIRKNPKDKLIEGRQSFSTINSSLRFEKLQKKLYKLILKNICRKEPIMHFFDNWLNKTFHSEDYIPFLRRNLSNSNIGKIKVQRKSSKTKKIKKTKKLSIEDEIKNKKVDMSVDNININKKKEESKKELKASSLKESPNSLQKDKNNPNLIYIINNENSGSKTKREAAKFAQIKEILNQDFDSESSDNKLLFNERKKNQNVEPFDQPSKSSVGANKKFQKNKDSKNRLKDKESKKMKEKRIKEKLTKKLKKVLDKENQEKSSVFN